MVICQRSHSKNVELGTDPRSAVGPSLVTVSIHSGFWSLYLYILYVLQMDVTESATWDLS